MSKMPEGAAPPIRLFYSYAHEDEVFRKALDKHLSALKRTGVIAPWHDRRIVPGVDWAHEIDRHLEDAHLILLLVSADFLASDYCWGVEMERALAMHRAGAARLVPVMVRPVDFEGVPFANLQALPREAKPITEWRNPDTAWADVAKGIRAAALDVRDQIRRRAVQPLPLPEPEPVVDPGAPHLLKGLDARGLRDLYRDYWTRFNQTYRHSAIDLRPPTPGTANYVRISLRSSDMRINAFVSVRDHQLGVELVLRRPACDPKIAQLASAKQEVEQALGHQLAWNEYPGSVRIVLSTRGYDPADRADWTRQHEWLVDKIKAYQQHLLARMEAR